MQRIDFLFLQHFYMVTLKNYECSECKEKFCKNLKSHALKVAK